MKQKTALQIMKSGRNVFLTGQAGSGKTYLLNTYIQRLRACDIPVAITASTGIAATHIGGVTVHSWSGIGIKERLSDFDIDGIASKKRIRSNILNTEVLIIDEISMLSAGMVDNINRIIQAVKYDERPR
jgi:DNA replication protein DnaC